MKQRVIALGFFDGVHLGHAALLRAAKQRAAECKATAAALLFDRHPAEVLGGAPVVNSAFGYYLLNYLPSLVIACVAATPVGLAVYGRLSVQKKMALSALLVAGGLVVCTAYLVASTYNPFLYFRF